MTRPLSALATALLVALLAGCGASKSNDDAGVELRVTRDFGTQRVGETASESQVKKGDTVLGFLQRNRKVTLQAGAVESIDGVRGDWFAYVNGEQSTDSPTKTDLHPGDVVQWDRHDATATRNIPAIVGAYTEPFIHGLGGRKFPTRIECSDGAGAACKAVEDRLAADGIIASNGSLGVSQRGKVLSVFIGPWNQLRSIHAAQTLEKGPQASGIYARFTGAGSGLDLLDAQGKTVKSLGPGAGLVAATKFNDNDGPTWIISGVDDAGTEAAARLIDPARLRDAFAVAALPGGANQRLPVAP